MYTNNNTHNNNNNIDNNDDNNNTHDNTYMFVSAVLPFHRFGIALVLLRSPLSVLPR